MHQGDSGFPLLEELLSCGVEVAIEHGRLQLPSADGHEFDPTWLRDNYDAIIEQILRATGVDAYRYETYGTGLYGPSRAGGVTLQFRGVLTDAGAYAVFNADLKRQRGPRKGEALPKGQFTVGQRSHFVLFWKRARLKQPASLTRFHQHMGNLRPIIFTGNVAGGRFDVASLSPIDLGNHQIVRAILTHNSLITDTQLTHNSHIGITHKDSQLAHIQQGLAPDQSTCPSKYGNTEPRRYGYTGTPPPSTPEELSEQDEGEKSHPAATADTEHPGLPHAAATEFPGSSGTRQSSDTSTKSAESVRPVHWLVEGYIQRGSIVGLWGAGSVGKSLLALDLAYSVATGSGWHGIPVQSGPVLYLTSETMSSLARRSAAWGAHHGVDFEGAPLSTLWVSSAISDEQGLMQLVNNIRDQVDAFRELPALVVADFIKGGLSQDPDTLCDFALVVDRLRRSLGATVLLVSQDEDDTGEASDLIDTSFDLKRTSEGTVRLVPEFWRGDEPTPITFTIEGKALPVGDGQEPDSPEFAPALVLNSEQTEKLRAM